jgi:ankyrin repeat protein/tellurite resistance protein
MPTAEKILTKEQLAFTKGAIAIVSIIGGADGYLDDTEAEKVNTFLQEQFDHFWGLTIQGDFTADVEAWLSEDNDALLELIGEAASLPLEMRGKLVTLAVDVAAADRDFDLEESDLVIEIASTLNLPPEANPALTKMIQDVRNALAESAGSDDEEDDDEEIEFVVTLEDDDGDIEEEEEDEEHGHKVPSNLVKQIMDMAKALEDSGEELSPEELEKRLEQLLEEHAREQLGISGTLEAALKQKEARTAYLMGDHATAYRLYLEAASGGDSSAMYNLGQMYLAGEGVPADHGKAVEWWVKAAEAGLPEAQKNAWLGLAAIEDERAVGFAIRTAEQGDKDADRFLKTITHAAGVAALVAGTLTGRAEDGVSDEEIDVFRETCEAKLGSSPSADDFREIVADLADISDEELLGKLLATVEDLPRFIRRSILEIATAVAGADGDVSAEESKALKAISAKLFGGDEILATAAAPPRQSTTWWQEALALVSEPHSGPSQGSTDESYDPVKNPVLAATLKGDIGLVQRLLASGHSPEDIDDTSGTNALIIAVREGHQNILEALLDAGADANLLNHQSHMTPLSAAARFERPAMVELLLKRGASPDPMKTGEEHPIVILAFSCVAKNHQPSNAMRMLDLFLEAGLEKKLSRMEQFVHPPLVAASIVTDLPDGFLSRLAERAGKDDIDLSLWRACLEGESRNVRDLLAAGAAVNMTVPPIAHDPTVEGDTPLNAAATHGFTECVRLLIEAGADVNLNAPPEGGQFPLLMAAEGGHLDIVNMLLAAGADPNMFNPENGTYPLGQAVLGQHLNIVRCLLNAGADPNGQKNWIPIVNAAAVGYLEIVRALLDHGADVNAAGPAHGNTALILAANRGHLDVVNLLLQRGADARMINPQNGADALQAAISGGQPRVVSQLLKAGANPNRRLSGDMAGAPILHLACVKGDAEIVGLLLQHGASPQATDGTGRNAIACARRSGHRHLVRLLTKT